MEKTVFTHTPSLAASRFGQLRGCALDRPATSACQRVSFTRSTRGPVSVSAIPRTTVVDTPNETVEQLERSLQLGSEPAGSSKKVTSLMEGDQLTSTWEHRLITGGALFLIATLFAEGVSEIASPVEAITGVAAFLIAYALSDFLTGVYHWSVDNYGDGNTPVVGDQIAAFQGHHQRPWTITEREFCNNVHKVFKPATPFVLLCLLASPWTPAWLDIGLATATLMTCMSQQFHAWSHMKGSELPGIVKFLQDKNILVSRKAHGAHHKAPFEGNYCIVSGAWNPILDAGGDNSFFRRLERFVHKRTGVEPRCWHEPDYTWQEMQ